MYVKPTMRVTDLVVESSTCCEEQWGPLFPIAARTGLAWAGCFSWG